MYTYKGTFVLKSKKDIDRDTQLRVIKELDPSRYINTHVCEEVIVFMTMDDTLDAIKNKAYELKDLLESRNYNTDLKYTIWKLEEKK